MAKLTDFRPGDPAIGFKQKASNTPLFTFDTAAGRHLLLCLFGSSKDDHAKAALAAVGKRTDLFDDARCSFFGVSMDPADEAGAVGQRIPGYRYFWDQDGTVGRAYRALPTKAGAGLAQLQRGWVLIDPTFRIVRAEPFRPDGSDIERMIAAVEYHCEPAQLGKVTYPAPVLVLPRVFEPEFCQVLLDYYKNGAMAESGFMVERDGQTVLKTNKGHKVRRDTEIDDQRLREAARIRIQRTLIPQIAKAYQFNATRVERYLVGCYTAEEGGHFNAHRDNTTKGTAHRKFAITIPLNEDYEGGYLRFPEFGPGRYKPPMGGAVVFSCSLLHMVEPVTKGERYVFVPFLYDDAAAKLRDRNRKFLKAG